MFREAGGLRERQRAKILMKKTWVAALAALALAAGCARDNDGEEKAAPERGVAQAAEPGPADLTYADDPGLSPEELERGRLDSDWTSVVQLDTTGAGVGVRNPERWEQIDARQANRTPIFLPLSGDVAGPSVLRVQVLLDRALFSPGIIDGRWGKNVEKAVYFFQQREGLRTTGRVDSLTFNRLVEAGGGPDAIVRRHTLTAEDVKGPFIEMPDSIYEQAKLDCSCYESLTEKMGELFHATPELLERLNPGTRLDGLQAGQTVNVPNVRGTDARAQGQVAELRVSGRGSYVQAVDASGRILYHFPSTLGSTYDPSPQGSFTVRGITKNPWWHFQPAILENVPDDKPEARIPPGPNNRVGAVWMALSEPHYGIHGTNKPETIGYATSAGCVRLTNWDALFLSDRIRSGTPVRFRDIQGRRGGTEFGGSGAAARASADSAAKGSSSGARSGSGSGSDTAASTRRTGRDTAASSRADTSSRSRPTEKGGRSTTRDTTEG
jgi:peptidoglycan hydrolase-like protein with peptidoglycan-binding domain